MAPHNLRDTSGLDSNIRRIFFDFQGIHHIQSSITRIWHSLWIFISTNANKKIYIVLKNKTDL